MKQTVYTVFAYRWGDRENHGYIVGVYSKKHAALKAAQVESDFRGKKYECEVLELAVDGNTNGEEKRKVILSLQAGDRRQD